LELLKTNLDSINREWGLSQTSHKKSIATAKRNAHRLREMLSSIIAGTATE
jgi:hypothetical protein